MSKRIPLTRGLWAIVDDDDFGMLAQYNWYAHMCGGGNKKRTVRAARRRRKSEAPGQRCVFMHQQILGYPTTQVDHINRNPLDNRRKNLRTCSSAENSHNSAPRRLDRYKGVVYYEYKPVPLHERKNKKYATFKYQGYYAKITCNGKIHNLGVYRTPEEAATAYDNAARRLFGEFAYLNFPSVAGVTV